MKFFTIKKKSGGVREIAAPSPGEKIDFQSLLPELHAKQARLCDHDTVHGFTPLKSPVTNAAKHIGRAYTLRFDLSNFFDTVTPIHLKGKLKDEIIDKVMPNGRAYQGLPTSPIVCNIAANSMDAAIIKLIDCKGIVYTRYADDLTFSYDDFALTEFLKREIKQIVNRCGFKLNDQKTWLQDARFGNRLVTGLAVSDAVKAPRRVRRQMRAALHNGNSRSYGGLLEWSKVKVPRPRGEKILNSDWQQLLTRWKLPLFDVSYLPHRETTDLGEDCAISGDPIHILGLSNFTTEWRSCMTHPDGSKHKWAGFWAVCKGTRIAGFFSDKTITYAGFERRRMKSRALVHKMRSGIEYYDRIYGESEAARGFLKKKLESVGICSIDTCPKEEKVSGNVPTKFTPPYLDSLRVVRCQSGGREVWILKK